MGKIGVLIVDDAVVVRRLVADVLANDPEIEVVGIAPSGRIALAKIPQVNPDVVILDVEMPDMDGLQTLAALRKAYPRLPVIMFSTLTRRGAETTLDALALGASDYVTKPNQVGSVGEGVQRVREALTPKIKALGRRNGEGAGEGEGARERGSEGARERGSEAIGALSLTLSPSHPLTLSPSHPLTLAVSAPRPPGRVEIVAIGVSTGGPAALGTLLSRLPVAFPVPIVIVQHMPPVFTRLLAERLSRQSALTVAEGTTGDRLRPGHAFVAPGDFHMVVERDAGVASIRLHQGLLENSCRPAVDVLFQSVARVYGARALAVVLTGMGQDGLIGSAGIREAGGRIVVQDEESSVVWGMPGFVARAGLADAVLSLDQIGDEILRLAPGAIGS